MTDPTITDPIQTLRLIIKDFQQRTERSREQLNMLIQHGGTEQEVNAAIAEADRLAEGWRFLKSFMNLHDAPKTMQ